MITKRGKLRTNSLQCVSDHGQLVVVRGQEVVVHEQVIVHGQVVNSSFLSNRLHEEAYRSA